MAITRKSNAIKGTPARNARITQRWGVSNFEPPVEKSIIPPNLPNSTACIKRASVRIR